MSLRESAMEIVTDSYEAFARADVTLMTLSVAAFSEGRPKLAIAYSKLAKVFRDFNDGRADAVASIVEELDKQG